MDENLGKQKERRRSPRIKKSLTAQYGYGLDSKEKRWDMTAIKDISQAGMLITTERSFAVGDQLYFRIKFPSKPFEWVEFEGRVVESKAHGFITRVEFLGLNEGQRRSLQAYIEWFLRTNKTEGIDEL